MIEEQIQELTVAIRILASHIQNVVDAITPVMSLAPTLGIQPAPITPSGYSQETPPVPTPESTSADHLEQPIRPKRQGRPKGSKNKPKEPAAPEPIPAPTSEPTLTPVASAPPEPEIPEVHPETPFEPAKFEPVPVPVPVPVPGAKVTVEDIRIVARGIVQRGDSDKLQSWLIDTFGVQSISEIPEASLPEALTSLKTI